ncbi:MAG: ABC transporter permease [Ignavibacteriae bacterium]|jgi:peptide/nickel transport system permease protein|nr:ABC transporter permease [Ignavibacteriota bacterium]
MIGYIIRKVGYALAVLFGVVTTAFLINFVLPGDPARLMLGQRADEQSIKALRVQLGLDKPMYEQYTKYVFRLVQGDLGVSYSTNREVLDTIVDKFPATALLAITAMFFSTLIGIGLGIIAAIRANTWVDASTMGFALLGISLPSFVFGLLLLLLFAEIWKIFPSSGYIDKGISHLFLPMLTLAFRPLSIIARVTRSSMLDVLNQDYVRTARAKGLTEKAVILKHALRNALNPVVTTVSAWFSGLLAGTFFVEYIFNWPGIGTLAISAIEKLDYPIIQGTVLLTAIIFVVVNAVVDILYVFLDPKVKLH